MNEKKTWQSKLPLLIFAGMLFYLLMQFSEVMVYFDDYAYYCLNYGADMHNVGHGFTLGELLPFLKSHYVLANGRIIGFTVWLGLYAIGGLTLVQISAAVFTLLVLWSIYRYLDVQEHQWLAAVLVCSMYGLFAVNQIRHGIYWFAAFFQYVAPVSCVFFFVRLYFRHREEDHPSWKVVSGLLVLAFLAACSQEQLAVTVCFMLVLLTVFELYQKNFRKEQLLYLVFAVAGLLVLVLSPAAQNRASAGDSSLVMRVVTSTYQVLSLFFAKMNRPFVILLYLGVFAYSAELKTRDGKLLRLVDTLAQLLACGSIFLYLCSPALTLLGAFFNGRYYALLVVGVCAVAVMVLQYVRYYFLAEKFSQLLIFLTAVGSVGCMCVLPEVPERLFIPSWFLLFPLMVGNVFAFAALLAEQKNWSRMTCTVVLTAVVAVFAVFNAANIYKGYAENAVAHRYNDHVLTQAGLLTAQGQGPEAVYLRTMPYSDCTGVMIYVETADFIKPWMCEYYAISPDTAFYYSPDGGQYSHEDYRDNGSKVFVK